MRGNYLTTPGLFPFCLSGRRIGTDRQLLPCVTKSLDDRFLVLKDLVDGFPDNRDFEC